MGLLDGVAAALSAPSSPEGGAFGYFPDPPRSVPPASSSGARNVLPRVNPISAVRSTDGTKLVASCGAPATGTYWEVRRLSVQGPASTYAMVYVGDYNSPASWVNGTQSGALDENECTVRIAVPVLVPLYLVWTLQAGGTFAANAAAVVRVEYDEIPAS